MVVQEAWQGRWATIWSLMNRSRPGPRYACLKAELNTISTSFARGIDTNPS